MTETDRIIKAEMEAIKLDILKEYEASGKKVSGKFETGLEVVYSPNRADIFGFTYLDGRRAGRRPPINPILRWVEQKGIFPDKRRHKSIAFAIANKIAKVGTSKEYHLKVYSKVITPERIDSIINKIGVSNLRVVENEILFNLELLQKNK